MTELLGRMRYQRTASGTGVSRVGRDRPSATVAGGTDAGYDNGVAWRGIRWRLLLVTVVLAVLAGTVYNNRRFDDVHRRIDDLRGDMNARFAQVDARLSEVREDLREIRTLLQEALRARAG
ncbi:MAG: hypothetical protein QN172_09175 [Armatimonadota bacterium]|nr:hypothetical protein [Armatimonadota bacterium]